MILYRAYIFELSNGGTYCCFAITGIKQRLKMNFKIMGTLRCNCNTNHLSLKLSLQCPQTQNRFDTIKTSTILSEFEIIDNTETERLTSTSYLDLKLKMMMNLIIDLCQTSIFYFKIYPHFPTVYISQLIRMFMLPLYKIQ